MKRPNRTGFTHAEPVARAGISQITSSLTENECSGTVVGTVFPVAHRVGLLHGWVMSELACPVGRPERMLSCVGLIPESSVMM